eukprot:scaffold49030_cov15-Tisochrysis_lutea.AAC.2
MPYINRHVLASTWDCCSCVYHLNNCMHVQGFSYKALADIEGSSASQSECDSNGPCSTKRAKFSGSGTCPVFTMILSRYEASGCRQKRGSEHGVLFRERKTLLRLSVNCLSKNVGAMNRETYFPKVMENETMTLDAVKQFDIVKDLSSALAYLHTQMTLDANKQFDIAEYLSRALAYFLN